ncbi:hypothetical protein ASC66_06650 [Leifsonia sp. Root4]|uniref:TetR/AcrR family transcriptional regulator n=1 Tax=Leifsonia sp. Root4 TaxID=1736525 RepID=UPI0006FB1609|nr:TetR/AcrR family transcriptional regulator [Leifsonia sp. Root4]KQW06204.1 hypothetical protein ASC66_06650 [Leifsonia sp. Root4]
MERIEAAESAQHDIRRTIQSSMDPRTARTRRAIVDAVESLLADGVSALNVSDIVRRAGVSRSAFYTHFASVDELAVSVLCEALEEIGSSDIHLRSAGTATGEEAGRAGIRSFVAHIDRHRTLYSGLLSQSAGSQAHRTVVTMLAAQTRETVLLLPGLPSRTSAAAAALFIAGGSLAVLGEWMQGDGAESVDEIVDELMALMPAWFVAKEPLRRAGGDTPAAGER